MRTVARVLVPVLAVVLVAQPILAEGFGVHHYNIGLLKFFMYMKLPAAFFVYSVFVVKFLAYGMEPGPEAAIADGAAAKRCKYKVWIEAFQHDTATWVPVGKKIVLKEKNGMISKEVPLILPEGVQPDDALRFRWKGNKGCAGYAYHDVTVFASNPG